MGPSNNCFVICTRKFNYTVKEFDSPIHRCWLFYVDEYVNYQLMSTVQYASAWNNHISHRTLIWLVNRKENIDHNCIYIYAAILLREINSILINLFFISNQTCHLHLMQTAPHIGRIRHIHIVVAMTLHHQIHHTSSHRYLHRHLVWWCFLYMINNSTATTQSQQCLIINTHHLHHQSFHQFK